MSAPASTTDESAPAPPTKRSGGAKLRPGDRVFSGLSLAAGGVIVVVLGAVALFLLLQAIPALTSSSEDVAAAAPFTMGNELLGLRGHHHLWHPPRVGSSR